MIGSHQHTMRSQSSNRIQSSTISQIAQLYQRDVVCHKKCTNFVSYLAYGLIYPYWIFVFAHNMPCFTSRYMYVYIRILKATKFPFDSYRLDLTYTQLPIKDKKNEKFTRPLLSFNVVFSIHVFVYPFLVHVYIYSELMQTSGGSSVVTLNVKCLLNQFDGWTTLDRLTFSWFFP